MHQISRRTFIMIGVALLAIPTAIYMLLFTWYDDEFDDLPAKPSPPAAKAENDWNI